MNKVLDWLVSFHFATWLAAVGSIGGVLLGVYKGGKAALGAARRVTHFLDEWMGEQARGNSAAVPGVLGRLTTIEKHQEDGRDWAQKVDHELRPNSGMSLRDQTNRLETGQDAIIEQLARVTRQLTAQDVAIVVAHDAAVLDAKETRSGDVEAKDMSVSARKVIVVKKDEAVVKGDGSE